MQPERIINAVPWEWMFHNGNHALNYYFWLTLFEFQCGHLVPTEDFLEEGPAQDFCPSCDRIVKVIRLLRRSDLFPEEGDSIRSLEDWTRWMDPTKR